MNSHLISKYNVPGPRYTSYPTVPYWNQTPPSPEQWKDAMKKSFIKTNSEKGISIYIHLPFCESLCTYCGCNTRITVNHKVETVYINAVLKEWAMYVELFQSAPNIHEIHLGGGTPTFFSPQNLKLLIEGIISKGNVIKNASFSFEAHPNNTTKEHLETLYALGFRRLSLGIQDFEPKVQEIVNRIQSYEKVKEVTQQARETGFDSINYDLIYGLPLQTKQSIMLTIEKVIELKPDRIAFYSYAHIPWLKPGQRKFTEADLPADALKRELYETGRILLENAGYKEIGMDHFALETDSLYKAAMNKTLHRSFMGYTDSNTELLIGLGVSAISDTWNGFAQNAKKVEDYYALLEKEQLPVVKGHLLNAEDLIVRRHILNLICNGETSWQNPWSKSVAVYYALERLQEMQQDGLVEIEPFHLKVTEAGKPFIRNVCMAFDARLWKNIPKTKIFSNTI